ncbi:MAG: carbamoyltransferase HypF [Peptococcaceae bacterium]|nr:carbamoyltransferase HypF [Peptococcaceae bacterium]
MSYEAATIKFHGVVQGVGFRPFVYRVAYEMQVKGWVNNTANGVTIHAEGVDLPCFYRRLLSELPTLALVKHHTFESVEVEGFTEFSISQSDMANSGEVLISPDVATCPECLADINSPTNRRYHYPFTNCTNCGPRYSIILDIPYDRPNTTMRQFTLCPDCGVEYYNPYDRRFHAQPIACPRCGPTAILRDTAGAELPGLGQLQIASGAIIAVKGLGGFHLACDALDDRAVEQLRNRKKREAKPFAVMARDLAVVKRYCYIDSEEEKLLSSPAAPIVVLQLKAGLSELGLPESLAPNLNTLGVMLPYTPLHHLLFADGLDLLVMTSANRSGEPLVTDNAAAVRKLDGIADYWLTHNRDICHPIDDSVIRVINGQAVFLRRARGYVPLPLELDDKFLPIMGVGGDMKNTFCLLKDNRAFISQHGGDLGNYDNYKQFTHAVEAFAKVVKANPAELACDLHPDYYSTRYARNSGLPYVAVQHHHAHLVSCLVENGVKDKVLGVVCDGTGFGLDGNVWGFEFLIGDRREFDRVGHLEYLPLPGGDNAVKYPGRIALAYLLRLLPQQADKIGTYFMDIAPEEKAIIAHQIRQDFNTYATSSCGRLFDAVAGLTGICSLVSYEGQAAIELEAAIMPGESGVYSYQIDSDQGMQLIRVATMFSEIMTDLRAQTPLGQIAAKFHNTIGAMILTVLHQLRCEYGASQVALTGGVFQNKYLVEYLVPRLTNAGFTVYQHRRLSPGDGSLCLGQAIIANEVNKNVSSNSR